MTHKKLPKELLDSINSLNKKMGQGTIMLGNSPIVKVDVIPTNIVSLDLALGVGGLPRGRMLELFGVESSGKTTTALQMVAACQQRGGIAAFIDAEHALDIVWAANVGVDVDSLLFNQPDSGEAAFTVLETLLESRSVDLVVIDSLAALVPQEELNGELEDQKIGAQARMISKVLRRLKGPINKSKTSVVFINQIRNKIGQMFGNPESTPGGLALKFYASVRIDMRKGAAIREGGKTSDEEKGMMGAIGMRTRVKIIKNKVARPFRLCEYDIYFGTEPVEGAGIISGIDTLGSLFDAACDAGVITTKGGNYYCPIGDQRLTLGNGRVNSIARLRADAALCQKITGVLTERCLPKVDMRTLDHDDLADQLSADEIDQLEAIGENTSEDVENETDPV